MPSISSRPRLTVVEASGCTDRAKQAGGGEIGRTWKKGANTRFAATVPDLTPAANGDPSLGGKGVSKGVGLICPRPAVTERA